MGPQPLHHGHQLAAGAAGYVGWTWQGKAVSIHSSTSGKPGPQTLPRRSYKILDGWALMDSGSSTGLVQKQLQTQQTTGPSWPQTQPGHGSAKPTRASDPPTSVGVLSLALEAGCALKVS